MEILNVNQTTISDCFGFLNKHEDSSQFLINNLREHGPILTAHHNSGNFKILKQASKIIGVFCLTRRGNLIAQTEVDCASFILEALSSESITLKGFIGDWTSIEPIVTKYRKMNPGYQPTYESKEILYSYTLAKGDEKLKHHNQVRFLEEQDFPQWLAFNRAYMAELSLPDELSDDQKQSDFRKRVQDKTWWGLFDKKTLLSHASLNSQGDRVGQIGGVFTPPQHRQKGYARSAMFHMLKDCRDTFNHRKSILFTGESDIPAQKLYESMGYNRIGSFALVLS